MRLSGALLTSDGESIAYDHYVNKNKQIVIIAHGFYNSKDAVLLKEIAQRLLGEYDCFLFDFRGHGKSTGIFYWTSKEEEDLNTVLRHLTGRYGNIGLIAFSLGASVSINVLAEGCVVDSFVSVSACSDVNKIDYRFWELDWENDLIYTLFTKEGRKGKGIRPGPFWFKKNRPIEKIRTMNVPVFFIHGDRDWVVKPWHSEVLYAQTQCKKQLEIIPGGHHAEYLMRTSSDGFIKLIREWLKETLPKKQGEL